MTSYEKVIRGHNWHTAAAPSRYAWCRARPHVLAYVLACVTGPASICATWDDIRCGWGKRSGEEILARARNHRYCGVTYWERGDQCYDPRRRVQ
jgi:hypothetical protein